MFKPPKAVRMELNLAPMVDVMMCLIIFFLLASQLADAENKPVKLAYALAAKEVDRNDLGLRVTINVRPANEDGSEAEYVFADWDGQQIRERVLKAEELRGLLTARAERARKSNEKIKCVIRADQRVMYKHVEDVLRGCGLAKISNIVFSANAGAEKEGGA
jgi:biopolymer transport protein ExbD